MKERKSYIHIPCPVSVITVTCCERYMIIDEEVRLIMNEKTKNKSHGQRPLSETCPAWSMPWKKETGKGVYKFPVHG